MLCSCERLLGSVSELFITLSNTVLSIVGLVFFNISLI